MAGQIYPDNGLETASPGTEIANLIAAIADRKAQPKPALAARLRHGDATRTHPADIFLEALNSQVESQARDTAKEEIDALANEIERNVQARRTDAALPDAGALADQRLAKETALLAGGMSFAGHADHKDAPAEPVAMPTAVSDWTWIEDVATAAIAMNKGKVVIGAEPAPADPATVRPVEAAVAEPPELPAEPERVFEPRETLYDLIRPDLDLAPQEVALETDTAEDVEPARSEGARLAWLQPGSAYEANEDNRQGLPLWLHLGLPLAAVSAAALAIALNNWGGAETSSVRAEVTPVEGAAPLETVLAPGLADVSPAARTPESVNAEDGVLAETVQSEAEGPVPERADLPATETPRLVRSADRSGVARTPAAHAGAQPVTNVQISARLAPAPGVKPANLAPARRATQSSTDLETRSIRAAERVPATLPGNRLPVRSYNGPIVQGSAAAILVGIANETGTRALTPTETRWLARDLEKVFDQELDGRSVSLKSRAGDRYRVSFTNSAQETRRYRLSRSRDMASLPDQMVLESGWYAATTRTSLRATPSVTVASAAIVLEPGRLVQRMATYTDRYGDRWYLVGHNGIAVGYVSPSEVTPAEAYSGDLGLPFSVSPRATVEEERIVFTRCRTAFVGPEGGLSQRVSACRNGNGHWASAEEGRIASPRQAAMQPVVLASNTPNTDLDPVLQRADIQGRLDTVLPYARDGQVLRQTLDDGSDISFSFGERYQMSRVTPIMRVDAVGRPDRKMKMDARWMHVPGGATLRPIPAYAASMTDRVVSPGEAVQTIGSVTDDAGESWTLVGRGGVGFGYLSTRQLAPLSGQASVRAISNIREARSVDLVEAEIPCRKIQYATVETEGVVNACQQANGGWALSIEPAIRQLADAANAGVGAAP